MIFHDDGAARCLSPTKGQLSNFGFRVKTAIIKSKEDNIPESIDDALFFFSIISNK